MSSAASTLCVFVRAPNLGRVKSRLAASIGDPAALAAYVELVDHLLDQLDVSDCNSAYNIEVQLWLGDAAITPTAHQQLQRWQQRTGHRLCHQQGLDLGLRMNHALASCVAKARYAVLVGSDCPTVNLNYVGKAIAALEGGADVVLGPAEDGGYGLIGVAQAQPTLFEGIAWGTDQVLLQTLEKADQAALQVELLESLWDVDYLADWERFCRIYR